MSERRGFLDEPNVSVGPSESPQTSSLTPGWIEEATGKEGPVTHGPTAVLPDPITRASKAPLVVALLALFASLIVVAVLEFANFIASQFERAAWLGWLTVVLLLPALAALAWSTVREWKGLSALSNADKLRQGLLSDDLEVAKKHAHKWLATIGASNETITTIALAKDAATLRSLLRTGPLAILNEKADAEGRAAALQVLAATAVSPWAGLDGLIVIWRGLRLVRRIAEIYGLRPGALGTLRIWFRITMDATAVAATDMAVTALMKAFTNSPIATALTGDAAGSALSAKRMLRLTSAVAQLCRPLP